MSDVTTPQREGNQASMEVLAIRFGTVTAPKSALFYGFGHYGEPDSEQTMDYFFWVVRGGGKTIVVDSGFDVSVGERRGRTTLIPPGDALQQVGIDPADVDQLVLTHFHYDHIGNVDLFPNAEILLAAREYDFYTSPLADRFQISAHTEDAEIAAIVEAHEAGRVQRIEGTVTAAPGVTITDVGGHAPGQLIVSIDTEGGEVILASDAVHLYEELDKDRPFHVLVDLPGMYEAFDLLRERQRQGSVVLPGHDPDVTSRFPLLDPARSDFAYRIG